MHRVLLPGESLWHFAVGELHVPMSSIPQSLGRFAKNVRRDITTEVAREGLVKTLGKATLVLATDALLLDPGTSLSEVFWPRGTGLKPTPTSLYGAVVGLTAGRLILIGAGSGINQHGEPYRVPMWVASYAAEDLEPSRVRMERKSLVFVEGVTLRVGGGDHEVAFVFGWPEDIAESKAIAKRMDTARSAARRA